MLQKITGEPVTMRSYLLSVSLQELTDVVTAKYKTVRARDIIDENISYTFQISRFGHLFILVNILLPNQLRIQSFVKASLWPQLFGNLLTVKEDPATQTFICLTEEHYLMVSQIWMDRCLRSASQCIAAAIPQKLLSARTPCFVSQFFGPILRIEDVKICK